DPPGAHPAELAAPGAFSDPPVERDPADLLPQVRPGQKVPAVYVPEDALAVDLVAEERLAPGSDPVLFHLFFGGEIARVEIESDGVTRRIEPVRSRESDPVDWLEDRGQLAGDRQHRRG